MHIDNLEQRDVASVQEKLAELSERNPAIESRVYPMDDQPTNAKIFEKLESIDRKLNSVVEAGKSDTIWETND
jgi:hypothetical protein